MQEHTESKLAFHGKKVEKFRRPTLEIEGIMVVTGLSSLITCSLETGDKRLLSAFAKRWHKKISSFPLPIGELTITLDDIASLLHLSITGAFPTFDAIDVEEVVDLLVELLEASTQEAKDETEQCKMTYVRLAWLGDIYHNKLFCKYYLWEIPNYKHGLISLHLDDSKIYHIQHLHLSIYANKYNDRVQEVSLVVAFHY